MSVTCRRCASINRSASSRSNATMRCCVSWTTRRAAEPRKGPGSRRRHPAAYGARLANLSLSCPRLEGRHRLDGLLIEREPQLRERTILAWLEVSQLDGAAVERDMRVLGEGERLHFRIVASSLDGDGDRPFVGVYCLDQAAQCRAFRLEQHDEALI